MGVGFGAFFLQYFNHIRMRRQIGTADTQADNIFSLPVQLIDFPQFLEK